MIEKLIELVEVNPDAELSIILPSGESIPPHFHVTEVGRVNKHFIDCGGTIREEDFVCLQVWVANDVDHRLKAGKLFKILNIAKPFLNKEGLPLMIEYGEEAAAQYLVTEVEALPIGVVIKLADKKTTCLAPDKCGVAGCC